jgi:hypothetical protein
MLSAHFQMKDLGEATSVLGIEIICDHALGTINLQQASHIQAILAHFDMTDCKPQYTPMVSDIMLAKLPVMAPKHAMILYWQAVGMLLYLAQATQLDIAYAVNYLCRFAAGFDELHWLAVKHLLRYLQGTRGYTICYCHLADPRHIHQHMPSAWSDSNWGGNLINRWSISVYIFYFTGRPISWLLKSQLIITLSSCEAEYIALSETIKQALYLHKLLAPLGLNKQLPIKIHSDNQGVLVIACETLQSFHPCTKHIDIRVHLHKSVTTNLVKLTYCPTERMLANILTKPLARQKFKCIITISTILVITPSTQL